MTKRFLSYTKGYRFISIICPFMMFFDVIIALEIPNIMGEVIDILYSIGTDSVTYEEITSALWAKVINVLVLCISTLVIGYVASRCSAYASMGFGANLRRELFFKIQELSFENIDKLKISSLITRMSNDVSSIQSVYSNIIVTFIKGPFMLIVALKYALDKSRDLSVIFYFALPAIIIALGAMAYLAFPLFKKMLKTTDAFNGTLRGNLNGIRVVKSFVREEHEKDKFDKVNSELRDVSIRAQKLILYITPVIMIVMYGCIIISLLFGSKIIIDSNETKLSVGELSAFVSYITQVLTSFMTIIVVFISMITAKVSVGRISEVFKEEPTVTDESGDENLLVENGDIEYKNVSFKYSEDSVKYALQDINLSIKSGETIGIIGATGSSKSTLIQLLPRIYDPTEGEIFVGGRNIKDYKFKNLRKEISVVLQQNILFSGSIKENIRWGKIDATDEEVIEAAKIAEADTFINEMENGYDTLLSQGGKNVSGGQRQRICIARALIGKPKILILDDSTSAVDTATDAKIRAALKSEKFSGITKIIIAQRITSIMDADRIVVINEGKIDSVGTHEELCEKSEIYHEIFVSQQEGVLAQ